MHLEEYNRRKEIDSDEAFSLAYYNAAWQRSKRMPSLKKLMDERKKSVEQQKPKQKQTDEEMFVMAMRLNARSGGVTKGG